MGIDRVATSKLFCTSGLLGCLLAAPAAAQEHETPAGAEHAEHFHRNEAVFLLGATYETEAGENLFTVGGEYARKLTPRVGVSAAFEHLSQLGAWVFVFPVGFRVYEGWTVAVAPGFEHTSRRGGDGGESAHEEPAPDDNGADNLFLFRVGVSYTIEVGERYSIIPGVAYDWVNEEHGTAGAWVYGAKFAIGF